MKKKFILAVLLVIPFFLYGQDNADYYVTQLGDIVDKKSIINIINPLLPFEFTMDDVLKLEDRLGVTHKSYNYVIESLVDETIHKFHVIKNKASIIVLFERSFDKRLIFNRMEINDMDIPLRGKLRMGMSKEEFCILLGVPFNKYSHLNVISIIYFQATSRAIRYYFNETQDLIAIHMDVWMDDSKYLDME